MRARCVLSVLTLLPSCAAAGANPDPSAISGAERNCSPGKVQCCKTQDWLASLTGALRFRMRVPLSHNSLGYRPTAPETASPPLPPPGSATLYLQAAMATETAMHKQSYGPLSAGRSTRFRTGAECAEQPRNPRLGGGQPHSPRATGRFAGRVCKRDRNLLFGQIL
jgi:hypothetical protein